MTATAVFLQEDGPQGAPSAPVLVFGGVFVEWAPYPCFPMYFSPPGRLFVRKGAPFLWSAWGPPLAPQIPTWFLSLVPVAEEAEEGRNCQHCWLSCCPWGIASRALFCEVELSFMQFMNFKSSFPSSWASVANASCQAAFSDSLASVPSVLFC